ncbi:30S ribosomal protein S2 [bacterium]|jgi:small subunit ribosomal protein S2|nr:30S ribosomal protein S2 [bacterium]MBT4292188.1 30S ribosomal protein S2 [bacterium]
MAKVGLKDLLQAGVHFGHQTSKWNPKMRQYIFIARNGIYILDLQKTLKALNKATGYIQEIAAKGGSVLFVGTKKQAKFAIREHAERCGMPYVTERWLGGMLTNWDTISNSVRKLDEIEELRATGKIDSFSKKEQLEISRRYEKLNRNLGGIRHMKGLPKAVFVVDTNEEETAVKEAKKLGIPVIGIVDTNCNPDVVSNPVPGNDDAIRAISLYSRVISQAVIDGRNIRSEGKDDKVEIQKAEKKEAASTVTLDESASEESKSE